MLSYSHILYYTDNIKIRCSGLKILPANDIIYLPFYCLTISDSYTRSTIILSLISHSFFTLVILSPSVPINSDAQTVVPLLTNSVQ